MQEFILILPEIFLILTLAFVVVGEITYHGEERRLVTHTALTGLAAAFLQTMITYQHGATQIFSRALSVDGLSLFFKLLFILLAALGIATAMQTREISRARRTEYTALVVATTLGMCVAAAAADALLAFLALQFVNVLVYFMAGYAKDSVRSIEAAVKYLVFASVSAALFLYGMAVLFISTHTLNIYEMHKALLAHPPGGDAALVALVLLFLAFAFQVAAFPMYLWAPDVLEGCPTPASAFLSFAPRAAGFAVAVRFFVVVFAQPGNLPGQWQVLGDIDWTRILAVISALTMLFGSLLAYRQTAAKRLVACLAIAQSGYLLIGLLVLDEVGIAAILYNLAVELFSLIGAYYVLAVFHDRLGSDRLEDLKGLLGRAVPECICLVLFLLCLVGLPPLPGFIGKFTLIGAAVRHQRFPLAVVAVLALSVSSAAIIRLAFSLIGDIRKASTTSDVGFEISTASGGATAIQRRSFLVALVLPILLLGIFAEAVLDWAGRSLGFILW